MKKICFLFGTIIGILILVGGILIFQSKKAPSEISMDNKISSDRRILMVIAYRDFRDEEYFLPKEILEKAGAEVKTASNEEGIALGADGGEVTIDFSIEKADVGSFDAVVFVGGPGCLENLDNENSYHLAKETLAKDKVLAAICVSPVILAKAGVLQGKAATVWSSALDKSAVKILEQNGVSYRPQAVVVDGKIITANGPDAAEEFVNALIDKLK